MSKYRVRQESGNRILYREVEDLPSEAHQAFRNGFFGYMKALKKRANKEILRKPKGGVTRMTRVNGRRRRHTASAPYETHANMSGALRRSLSWKVYGWETAEFGYGVSTNATNRAPEYAPFVEEGTRFMKPRPSLSNAVRDVPADPFFDAEIEKFTGDFGS